MRGWKRLLYYLLINVLVSTCTVLTVLTIWNRTHPQTTEEVVKTGEVLPPEGAPVQVPSQVAGSEGNIAPPTAPINPTSPSSPATATSPPVQEYHVQPGDTLADIANRFGVTIEELAIANNLADPNRLDVGQVLLIPSGASAPSVSPTRPNIPGEEIETVTPSPPTATLPAVVGQPRVAIENVIGAGDLTTERVLLKNIGSGELSLAGWQLLEEDGQVYTFPQLTLFEGGAVNLHTKAGQPTVVDLYWGLGAPVWRTGETVILLDAQGNVHATFRVP